MVAKRADRHPSGPLRAANRHPSQSPEHGSTPFRAARFCRSNTCPDARIEHLRGRAECESNTCTLPHARADRTLARSPGARIEQIRPAPCHGSNTCSGAETADRTPPEALDPVDRDPLESPDARIDTLPTRSVPWIDTLRGRRARGSRPFRPARTGGSNTCRARGSNTCPVSGGADRHPSESPDARIDTLRSRRTRGSTPPPARSMPWIDTLRGRRARGSTPFRSARSCGSNTCRTRGSNTCTLLHARGSNTCPVSGARIEQIRSARSRGSRPFGVAGRADRHPSGPIHAMDRHPSRAAGARIDTLPVRSILRIERLPDARIEHLRGRAECGSNTCTLLHARGSNTCAVPGDADRTDPVRSIPWIETLRSRRTRGSTPFRPDPCHGSTPLAGGGRADRHPSGPLDPADRTLAGRADRTLTRPGGVRIEHLHPAPRPRIEHLRGPRGRGSNRSGPLDPVDRDPSESPGARIETLPAGSAPWIDTLRGRRARGSRPFQSARTGGSNTCAAVGDADRDPSSSLHAADRHPSRSPERRSTPFRRLDPMDRHPSARPDRHPSRSPNSADRHPFRPLDPMDRDPSRSSGRGSTPFTVAGRRESGRSSGGTAVSTERPAALRLPTRFDCA